MIYSSLRYKKSVEKFYLSQSPLDLLLAMAMHVSPSLCSDNLAIFCGNWRLRPQQAIHNLPGMVEEQGRGIVDFRFMIPARLNMCELIKLKGWGVGVPLR